MRALPEYEATIESIDHKGLGVAPLENGRNLKVYFTCPGDVVKVKTVKRRRGEFIGKIIEIIKPSKHRVKPRCPYAGICGGCKWQMIDYDYQLELKKNLINNSLKKHSSELLVDTVTPSSEIFYFRNRMDYVFGPEGTLGLKEPGNWYSFLNLSECHLLSPEVSEILNRMRLFMNERGLEPWNNKKFTGFLRYLVIREGKNTNERMIHLITGPGQLDSQGFVDTFKDLATTIHWGINSSHTDVSIPDQQFHLYGTEYLTEVINGLTFQIHPVSFFQTNSTMAGVLQNTVREFAEIKPGNTLLDLYCGSGFMGLGLARDCKKVIGIELDPFAIENAKKNAAINNIDNAEYFVSKAEEFDWAGYNPDVVILDPPRSGLHPKTVKAVMENLPKKLVYVSCNFQRFAEEIDTFQKRYTMTRITAIDMFPHGPHVELVAVLERK